ncbi:MAG TPA: hypothetical protein VKB46_13910 [Pyrinomonadaceae bacterium]|nr:hypothetical protein [Pyrinomonadaceae bacterium]
MRKATIKIGRTVYLAKAIIVLLCVAFSCAAQTRTPDTAPASQVKIITAIGQDIANLKAQFPQLREFSVSKNVLSERLIITYDYHTHRSQIRSGWRAQVPEPDDDGVWFYIDFHDPGSTDQIHTQPTLGWPGWPPDCFEDKKVSFLMLEGNKTSPVSGEISEILHRYGVKLCTAPASQVKIITAIGQDIANLKAQFPQLRKFSVSKNVRSERLIIDYDYHTHRSQIRGGWRAQVPEPDDDGVWFYIDFHDPASGSQIDTQPGDPQDCFEDKKVQFLILQGDKTRRVSGEIWKILEQHGVKKCADRTW